MWNFGLDSRGKILNQMLFFSTVFSIKGYIILKWILSYDFSPQFVPVFIFSFLSRQLLIQRQPLNVSSLSFLRASLQTVLRVWEAAIEN